MRTILTSDTPPLRQRSHRPRSAGSSPVHCPIERSPSRTSPTPSQQIDPAIGLATVYRAVSAMEDSGWLTRVGESGGNALYARCERAGHHHHAVCMACGRVEHTPCPVGEDSTASVPPGFRVTSHELTLYGLCDACDPGDHDPSPARASAIGPLRTEP